MENRERYDYCSSLLRRFAVLKEEIQVIWTPSDYAFILHGLVPVRNMPLLSLRSPGGVPGGGFHVVTTPPCPVLGAGTAFLEETHDVLLSWSESFFRRATARNPVRHQIRSDVVTTRASGSTDGKGAFRPKGLGGTDFRPYFEGDVNGLVGPRGRFKQAQGSDHFTDGKGIYPVQARPRHGFCVRQDQYSDESVPPWAMKVILDTILNRPQAHSTSFVPELAAATGPDSLWRF